jgi:Arc/MetJ-type ribon-helix-helix transcriptional regulator
MSTKQRLSASVDADVLVAAEAAVSEGRAANVSAWVNEALQRHAKYEARMRALDAFLRSYETKHGAITDDEIDAATRRARERAIVVRGKPRRSATGKQRRGGRAA